MSVEGITSMFNKARSHPLAILGFALCVVYMSWSMKVKSAVAHEPSQTLKASVASPHGGVGPPMQWTESDWGTSQPFGLTENQKDDSTASPEKKDMAQGKTISKHSPLEPKPEGIGMQNHAESIVEMHDGEPYNDPCKDLPVCKKNCCNDLVKWQESDPAAWTEVNEAATKMQPFFRQVFEKIRQQLQLSYDSVLIPSPKTENSSKRKAKNFPGSEGEFCRLADILRGIIIFQDPSQLLEAVDMIKNVSELDSLRAKVRGFPSTNLSLAQLKNSFPKPPPHYMGFRDIKVIFGIRILVDQAHLLAEVQLQLKPISDVQEPVHKIYEAYRQMHSSILQDLDADQVAKHLRQHVLKPAQEGVKQVSNLFEGSALTDAKTHMNDMMTQIHDTIDAYAYDTSLKEARNDTEVSKASQGRIDDQYLDPLRKDLATISLAVFNGAWTAACRDDWEDCHKITALPSYKSCRIA